VSTWTAPERVDPPSLPIDERAALEAFLDYHRQTLLWKCSGLTPAQLATRACPPSTLSLLGLVRHLTEVENWFHAYDGQPTGHRYSRRERPDADFDDVDPARADADLERYLRSCQRARAAVAGRSLDQVSPARPRSLRWIYLHMLEEYARHNGHADLLRQAIDGATGE
jgi:hypothetical protein